MSPNLAELVDRYWTQREARLAAQREVDRMEKAEKETKAELIAAMKASTMRALGGQIASVELKTKPVPKVEDWAMTYRFIQQTGHFQLLQKRLSETAVKEFWEADQTIPGVVSYPADDLSLHKL